MARRAAGLVLLVLLEGCAARGPLTLSEALVHRGGGGPTAEIMPRVEDEPGQRPRASMEAAKAFAAAMAAHPIRSAPPGSADTVERLLPEVRLAQLRVAAVRDADSHRALANLYLRVGVRDLAYDEYQAVLRADPRDPGAADGLARIWRDWGYPDRALPHAYRAAYFAPQSSTTLNTLGTVLLRLGWLADAEHVFHRANAASTASTFALNNLCYAAVLRGAGPGAVALCRQALEADPASPVVMNNLGLAYAATGDLSAAEACFEAAMPGSKAQYNLGLALMATGRYGAAAHAFEQAARLGPGLSLSRLRAARARVLATQHPEHE